MNGKIVGWMVVLIRATAVFSGGIGRQFALELGRWERRLRLPNSQQREEQQQGYYLMAFVSPDE